MPSFQLLERGQQGTKRGAVGLVDAVVQSGGKQVRTALGEGDEQKHRILNVDHSVGAGVLHGKDAAGFLGGKWMVGDGKEERPLPFRADTGHLSQIVAGHPGDGEAAHPTGGGVVRMMLTAGGFTDDLGVAPSETAEVNGEGDSGQAGGGGRAAAFANGNVVVDVQEQRHDLIPLRLQDLAVGGEDEVVVEGLADFTVAAHGGDREFAGDASGDLDVQIKSEGGGIESRAEVGRGGGEGEAERASPLRAFRISHESRSDLFRLPWLECRALRRWLRRGRRAGDGER